MEIIEGAIDSPKGFHADGKFAGLKRKRKDIGWIVSEVPASAAAVYTTNIIQAAPIAVTKASIQQDGTLQAIIVNSGNANACTGKQGTEDAKTMRRLTAERLQLSETDVAVASTGIIGETLPMEKITTGIKMLETNVQNGKAFQQAILTTDTFEKTITCKAVIDGNEVTMSGVSKGSGMIHPNMATMLAFITTDAAISPLLLQQLLKRKVDQTFNQITVDGDTSTNDMVIVMANGMSGAAEIFPNTEAYEIFTDMFHTICEFLAKQIARDGEGATKLIEINVKGATNSEDARMIAKKIVSSSLVKTAIFGGDANWGRIICAIGYSGGRITPDNITIKIGDTMILQQSEPVEFSQAEVDLYLRREHIVVDVNLHIGIASGTAWGCDLSYEYVKINACYHT